MFHAPWLRSRTHAARRCGKHNPLRLESLENRLALSANALAQVVVNLAESSPSQAYGQSETFSVHVAPATTNAATPTGIVDFMDGTTDLGNRALDTSGNANFRTCGLSVGAHDITAIYGGNGRFAKGTSEPVTDTVSPATTLTTLDANPSQTSYGQAVELTTFVAVAGSNRENLGGQVTFSDGSASLGTVSLGPCGFARLAVTGLSVNSHALTAVYGGDPSGDFSGSTSPVFTEVVGKGVTRTIISASTDPSVVGQAVTFSVQVCAPNKAGGVVAPPSGQVTLLVDGVAIGSSTIDNAGKATFATSSLALGGHAIMAVYQGNNNFDGSTSRILGEHVIKATPGTAQGNGSIKNGADCFSFTASAAYDANDLLNFSGNMSFDDTQDNVSLNSTAIDGLVIGPWGNMATLVGTATVNGQAGYHFWATVGDSYVSHGAPGSLEITIVGPNGFRYVSAGPVDAGGSITISPASPAMPTPSATSQHLSSSLDGEWNAAIQAVLADWT
ncbi:MAG: Ig-like domain repeat protein [Thermoguttaceae bacterium]